jgi:hypothetical protein
MTWAPDGRRFNMNSKLRFKLRSVFRADKSTRKREIGIIRGNKQYKNRSKLNSKHFVVREVCERLNQRY